MPDLNFNPNKAIPDLSGKVILITGGRVTPTAHLLQAAQIGTEHG
jgi:hypothetical protein